MQIHHNSLPLALALAALSQLAACSDDDDGSSNNGGGGQVLTTIDRAGPPMTVYVGKRAAADTGEVELCDRAFTRASTYFVGNDEGLDLDYYGNLYQAGDGPNGPGVRVFARARSREDLDRFDPVGREREIRGAATTLVNPKGVHISHGHGLVLVADHGASSVVAFGTTAGGNVPPLATANLAVAPWDLFHDEMADRLFVALTDGTVGVIDDFVAGGFQGSFSRVIAPVVTPASTTSAEPPLVPPRTSLRGLVYDVAGDRLVVSDVGDPDRADDGAVHVIADASRAAGEVATMRTIAGPRTLLGNPVDLALAEDRLRVAEQLNGGGRLLQFERLFTDTASDVAPIVVRDVATPDSLTLEVDTPSYLREASDLDGPQVSLTQILTTRSDGGSADIRRHDPATLAETRTFDTGFSVQSLDVDVLGDVYVTTSQGALLVLNRLATGRVDESASPARDRAIQASALVAPKGIEVVDARGLVLVAESVGRTSPGILGYSMEAQAFGVGATPLLEIDLTAAPWDLDYDETNDRLFVALTNGTVAVFDDLLDGPTRPTAPDRVFRVASPRAPGVRHSVNLHGIVYDAVNDRVLLSDVNETGGGAFDTDGRIFVVDDASTASGVVTARVHLEGPTTGLGNPVDIAFDGVDLFVAEKANGGGRLLRFASIAELDSTLATDVAPTASIAAPSVESVALVRVGLAPTRGGSLVKD
jgi:hypothetical protein